MIKAEADSFEQWRGKARELLGAGVTPDAIVWQGAGESQSNLFADKVVLPAMQAVLAIPPALLTFMKRIACHRDIKRWDLLYQMLWRVQQGETQLYRLTVDPLMHQLQRMDGEVRRDAHKTKAFVRFRCVQQEGEEYFIAWHKPDHRILPLVAPFFQRRFSVMQWSILTPDESISFDGQTVHFGPGVAENPVSGDDIEKLWLAFYGAIFNPARIKIKMMKREMPVRHWPSLPETVLIPQLLADAPNRVASMIKTSEGSATTAQHYLPETRTYEALVKSAAVCKGCDLHCHATQTVFGEGPANAALMLVGEQPGDAEDIAGRVFVGPAGQMLNDILDAAGYNRSLLYITNAVKHFKFTRQAERRMHRNPDSGEIIACKPWLLAEIDLVKPKAIVTLGVTAARALVHHGFSLKHDAATLHQIGDIPLLATWHPSALLRATDEAKKQDIRNHIQHTLAKAHHMIMAG